MIFGRLRLSVIRADLLPSGTLQLYVEYEFSDQGIVCVIRSQTNRMTSDDCTLGINYPKNQEIDREWRGLLRPLRVATSSVRARHNAGAG